VCRATSRACIAGINAGLKRAAAVAAAAAAAEEEEEEDEEEEDKQMLLTECQNQLTPGKL
jgi:ribosomal protein L12E/L44/L45/RPP1/RPP2